MIESIRTFFGYIDPGTGSIVLQVLIAMVLSAGIIFRRALVTPIAMFCGKNHRQKAGSDSAGQHQEGNE
jgi:hypothetical protein